MKVTNIRISEPFPPWPVPLFDATVIDTDGYYKWTAYRFWRIEVIIRSRVKFYGD